MLVLVVYGAWLSSQLTWFLLDSDSSTVMLVSQNDSAPKANKSAVHRSVSGLNLFGKEGLKPVVKKDVPTQAPKTRLRLKLKGVFTAEQGGESGAIVEEQGKSADYYRIGDTLPGNAILEEVYSDRILLRRSGKLEALYFEEASSKGETRIAKTEKPKRPAKNSSKKRPKIESPEQFMEEATRQLAENPEQALQSVGLAPSEEGYVYQGNNPMLSGLNLRKGDVIRSVNGHTLGDIRKDKELMQSLYEQGSLDVEVVRDGASFYINYPLR